MTYRVVPGAPDADGRRCRLVVKLLICWPSGLHGAAMRALLPAGDLVMMRRQLLNFKALAERDAAGAAGGAPGGAPAPALH